MTGQIVKERSGAIVTLTISNPHRLNALTTGMWQDLREHVRALSEDEGLRCLLIRGASEKAFSAGADVSEFGQTRSTFEQVVRFHEEYVLGCLNALADCPVPVVAAIQGVCFGGGLEIAAVCDLRIAEAGARFGAPVGRMGFPLAFAETEAVVRLVGPAVAAELLIEGRTFDARTAYEKGLITRAVDSEVFQDEVDRTVENVCRSGVFAARSHKRQIRRLVVDPSPVSFEERLEVYRFVETEDYHQGIKAFLARSDR